MKIKAYFLKKLHAKILKDLRWKKDYEGLVYVNGDDVENDITLSNRRCHLNSTDVYKKRKYMEIKVCFTKEKGVDYGFIHFINYNTKTGKYFDNTLGASSPKYSYYILEDTWLKRFKDDEVAKPWLWLDWAKNDLYERYCTDWIWRLFIKEEMM